MATKVGMISLGCCRTAWTARFCWACSRSTGTRLFPTPPRREIIFVNTCGFIESAKEESIDAIFEMAEYKKTGRLKKLFVTGCLSQRYPDALKQEIPEVDGLMGVSDYGRIFEFLKEADGGARPMCTGDGERFLKAERVLTTPSYSAYVKISDGCSNRCAYCAIPLIRGPYRSRPYDDILEECRALAARGVTELIFIAQDTSRYGNDFPEHTLLLPRLRAKPARFPACTGCACSIAIRTR